MYGREKLKTYESCELYDKNSDEFKVGEAFLKEEADAVMDAMENRIKELEEAISKTETTTPKWISVKDRLPKGNPMLPALTEDGNKTWWGNWHDGNLEIYGMAYWLENAFPPPPTTEESSAIEKEK